MISMDEKMRVLVIGAGAVGVYFASHLKNAEVSVVCRKDFAAVKRSGFYQIKSINGDYRFYPALVLSDASQYQGEADYVFYCAKTTAPAAEMLKNAVRSSRTTIVMIQNGIGIEEDIAAAFPENELISTVAYIGASRPEPGVISHEGSGHLQMGSFPSGKKSPKADALVKMFLDSGVQCVWSDDIQLLRWKKLLWNISYNTISVLGGGLDTRQMLKADGAGLLCAMLMRETVKVAKSCGVPLEFADAEKQIDYNETFPAYRTSMLQDYLAGKPLEVEAIVGNVLRIAQKNHVEVPGITFCYHLLASMDKHNPNRDDNKN